MPRGLRQARYIGRRKTRFLTMGLGVTHPRRGEVHLVALSPTRGQEIRKTRPGVVVSPDELNAHLGTFLAAPITTGGHPYPFRVECTFQGRDGFIVLDQVRAAFRPFAGWFRGTGRRTAPGLTG